MAEVRAAAPALAPAEEGGLAGGAATALAWLTLALADAAVGVLGFDRFYRMIRRWPTLGTCPAAERETRTRAACAAVERARTWYLRPAWCLRTAAAAVCCMRLRGVRAELVIGVRRTPFLAHAWAEVDGRAVNNLEAGMDSIYRVITRC
jgi:Transglutaminase-like superfamily